MQFIVEVKKNCAIWLIKTKIPTKVRKNFPTQLVELPPKFLMPPLRYVEGEYQSIS